MRCPPARLGGSRIHLTRSAGTEAGQPGMTTSIGGTRTPNWLTSVGSLVRTCVQFSYSARTRTSQLPSSSSVRRVALSSARMSVISVGRTSRTGFQLQL